MPYSHEEGFPGPELESVIWPPVPLFENRDLIQQPVNMETLTPKYTNKTLELLDELSTSEKPFFMYVSTGNTNVELVRPCPHTHALRRRYVGYEEAHVPLFASPEFQGISRRGAYGDTVTQMDASIGG